MCELTFIVAHTLRARVASAAIANLPGRRVIWSPPCGGLMCETNAVLIERFQSTFHEARSAARESSRGPRSFKHRECAPREDAANSRPESTHARWHQACLLQ